MKKVFFLISLLIFSILNADTLRVEWKKIKEFQLESIKTISWGADSDQVGLIAPTREEELYRGVSSIAEKDGSLLLLDSVNRRLQVMKNNNISTQVIERARIFSDVSKRDKTSPYPYSKFSPKSIVKVVFSAQAHRIFDFSEVGLHSFLIIGQDNKGNIYVQVETTKLKANRWLLVFDSKGRPLKRIRISTNGLYRPEKDVVISPFGKIYHIIPLKSGLRVEGL